MLAEDLLSELESLPAVNSISGIHVSIQRAWKRTELPWSCQIWGVQSSNPDDPEDDRAFYGTGNTLTEAIEDALEDLVRD